MFVSTSLTEPTSRDNGKNIHALINIHLKKKKKKKKKTNSSNNTTGDTYTVCSEKNGVRSDAYEL